jgi:hypothetical protein
MKKLLASAFAAVALLAGAMGVAQAATATGNFNVTVTLTAQCTNTTAAAQAVDFGTYTAFQAGAQTPATQANFTFNCTRGLPAPTFAFDGGFANGTVGGLLYTLTPSLTTTTAGTAAAGGGAPTIGTATAYAVNITGSMAALQAGDVTAATTAARTITVTW